MRRVLFLVAVLVLALLVSAGPVQAQTASGTLAVSANNQGIFLFSLSTGSFDFGTVDASGVVNGGTGAGVTGAGRTGANDGGVYNAVGATSWTCSSAPQRTVRIYNASSVVSGALPGDRLELRVPAAGGGATQGFKTFLTSGTPAGDLVTGMAVRNGANSVTGTLDLRLTVLDSDPLGATTWTVVLTASGT